MTAIGETLLWDGSRSKFRRAATLNGEILYYTYPEYFPGIPLYKRGVMEDATPQSIPLPDRWLPGVCPQPITVVKIPLWLS